MERKSFFQKGGCLPLIFIVFGLPFFSVGGWEVYKEVRLKLQGKIAVAKVLDKTYISGDDGNTYDLKYEYNTKTNLLIVDECQVKYETWQNVEKGDSISIIYVPGKTYINRMVGEDYFVLAMVFMIVGLLICSIGVGVIVKQYKIYNMMERLERKGVSIRGKVVRVKRVGEFNNVPHSVLYYSFLNPNENSDIEGESGCIPTRELVKYHKGDAVKIIYNPDKPTEHYWADEQEIIDRIEQEILGRKD